MSDTLSVPALSPYELYFPRSTVLEAKWERLSETNPRRVVGLFDLRLTAGARTRWGDTPPASKLPMNVFNQVINHADHFEQDIAPAIRALRDAAHHARIRQALWQGLLRAGLVEKLCQCISGECTLLEACSDGSLPMTQYDEAYPVRCSASMSAPDTTQTSVILRTQMMSSYYPAVEMIFHTAVGFARPWSAADRKVVETLRKYWTSMMNRVCHHRLWNH